MALSLGYANAALWQAALARALPMARIDATMTATMASFAIFAGAAVWAFAARTVARAATGLAGAAILAALLLVATR